MDYLELDNQEILDSLTDSPRSIFEPLRDELNMYANNSIEIHIDWSDPEVTVEDGRLCLYGYPLHPFTLWRLMDYIVPTSRNQMKYWEDNLDIMAQVYKRGLSKFGGAEGKLIVYDGEVIVANSVDRNLYNHIDFFKPVLDSLEISIPLRGALCAITGIQMNPVWPFMRLIIMDGRERSHYIGYQIEANFIFRKGLSRASVGHYTRNFKNETDVDLSPVWSVQAPRISRYVVDLKRAFDKKFSVDKGKQGLSASTRKTETWLKNQHDEYATKEWKQAKIIHMRSRGVSTKNIQQSILDFRYGSRLDFISYMLKATKSFPLDRRILIERHMVKSLKE